MIVDLKVMQQRVKLSASVVIIRKHFSAIAMDVKLYTSVGAWTPTMLKGTQNGSLSTHKD